ncbi:MAG: ABC transporter ATP-binding protein [Clostridiales bacterium]|nr:ABC transporter ATP-binding protein [Clostridiales bacterium]
MKKDIKSYKKILPVIKTLFPTAAKKYPLFFILQVLKTLIEILQPFLGLYVSPLLVDELVTDRNIRKLVMYAAILVAGEFILSALLEMVLYKLRKYQERLDNYFSMQIARHSMALDFQLTEDKKALDQLEKAKTGMTWYSGGAYGIAEQAFMFVGNVFKITGFITLIAVNAPWLILIISGYVAFNGFITSKCNAVDFAAYKRLAKINRLFGYFGWNIVDFRYGKDVRLYDARDMLVDKWVSYSEDNNATWKWQADSVYRYRVAGSIARAVTTIMTYLYLGILAVRKVFSIGIFTQMIESANALDSTMNGLVWNVQDIIRRCNYAYEYVLFMEYPEAIEKNTDKVQAGLHMIEFRNVSFAYPGTDRKVLEDINITIEPGEKLSIVGLNGAGKTTFIKLLCRLYDPTSGQILMDGKDIREYDYQEYMKQFAPVFQDFQLLRFTIGENILHKDPRQRTDEEKEKVDEIIRLVGLEDMVGKLGKGIDTTLFKIFEEDGIEPSGGEQQKIAIARALNKDAPVIILDEPTAALDPIAEYEIYRHFHTLVGNKTALYISHRLSSCRFCDRIAVFADGRIAEYGSHDELVNIPDGIYAKMFEAQAQYYR